MTIALMALFYLSFPMVLGAYIADGPIMVAEAK
jgi:hypothetical protein